MADTKRKTVTKQLQNHPGKRPDSAEVYRDKTVRKRMLGAIKRALSEMESLDTLSQGSAGTYTGRHA